MKPGDLGISYDLRIIDIDNDGDFDIMPRYTITEDNWKYHKCSLLGK